MLRFRVDFTVSQNNLPENDEKLSFTSKHIPLSVGIASNIPNFEDPICFVSEGNETVLVQKMVDCMEKLSDAAHAILQERYEYVFNALAVSPNCCSENLLKEFDAFIRELPILGYNSSKYDLPLIQAVLIRELVEKFDFVMKKANTYLCLKTAKLRFLDIRIYISPGFSYRFFLLACGCTAGKFLFLYCFNRASKALEHPSVPPYEAFFSEITNSNISFSKYEFVKKVWKEKEWKTLKDMLIYYNVMDCGPFVEGVGKMLQPYLAQGIDIFKSSFSVSGVAKIQMFQKCEKAFFCLFFPKGTLTFIIL